jgi:acyl-CoA synthetase (AMP-forming)/AMP-acid ligase II/acyl carrier protein
MTDLNLRMGFSTLIDVLEKNQELNRTVTFIEGENAERRVHFRDIVPRALGILHHLQAAGAKAGDHMIIFLNNNEQFLDGFWAAIVGGIIPVPLAVGISDEHRHKLLRVARKLGNPMLYTDAKSLSRLESLATESSESDLFAKIKARAFLVESITDISKQAKLVRPKPNDIAFIQFSSGSTSVPKGVMLTHDNILANGYACIHRGKFSNEDISLSWMPLTHDMGLIGFYLMLFAAGLNINLMPTDLFVRRPLLWMQLASRKRVTATASPNFGYRHFLKVLGDRKLEDVELSNLRIIYNGAEPISVSLCNEFMTTLAYTGLKRSAMYPVYGLAEATLAAGLPEAERDYRWIRVNRHRLSVGNQVEVNPAEPRDALELMCVGHVPENTEMLIADDNRVGLADGQVGHILIRGSAITQGYFADPETTAATIDKDGWLDTGDLGFYHEAGLYIAGRAKEIIFVNGQNYYPYDLENIAQRAPGLDLNKVVAAGVLSPGAQGEELILFVLHRGTMQEFLPTATAVGRLVNEHTGLEVAQVVPTKRIPKTTSGKVQRHLLEQGFIDGEFDAELTELKSLRESQGDSRLAGEGLAAQLQTICEAALPGKRIDVNDNLFEIGASSLKLIEIHENIERDFPGLIELTELFDYPTIGQLAEHLEKKLKAKNPH